MTMICGARSLTFVAIYAVLAGMSPLACATSDVDVGGAEQEPEPLHLYVQVRRQAAVEGKYATFGDDEEEKASQRR